MIKLKLLLTEIINEIGDLEKIKSLKFINNYENNYIFNTKQGWKVDVRFQQYGENDLVALRLNRNIYSPPVYNVVFDVEGIESQFQKTTLEEYYGIIKTIAEICKDFINKNNPNGLIFFGASKNPNDLFKTDPQKTKFYKVIIIKQLSKLIGWKLVNLKIDENFEGFMIYNFNNKK